MEHELGSWLSRLLDHSTGKTDYEHYCCYSTGLRGKSTTIIIIIITTSQGKRGYDHCYTTILRGKPTTIITVHDRSTRKTDYDQYHQASQSARKTNCDHYYHFTSLQKARRTNDDHHDRSEGKRITIIVTGTTHNVPSAGQMDFDHYYYHQISLQRILTN